MDSDWIIPRESLIEASDLLWDAYKLIVMSPEFGEQVDSYLPHAPDLATYCSHVSGLLAISAGMLRGVGRNTMLSQDGWIKLEKTTVYGQAKEFDFVMVRSGAIPEEKLVEGEWVTFSIPSGNRTSHPRYIYWTLRNLVETASVTCHLYDGFDPVWNKIIDAHHLISDKTESLFSTMTESFYGTVDSLFYGMACLKDIHLHASKERVADEYRVVSAMPGIAVGDKIVFSETVDRVLGIWEMPEPATEMTKLDEDPEILVPLD